MLCAQLEDAMPFGSVTTKGRKYAIEILTSEEVRAIIARSSSRCATGIRDRALTATLYRAGLRINEALTVYPKDVDTVAGTINVLNGKGGKQRVVGIDGETVALIERWIDQRVALGLNGRQPLFCTLKGGALGRVQVSRRLKKLAAKAGIEKRVHPHGFRHSRAVDLVRQHVPLPIIQRAYGHTSLETTQTYVSHIAPQEVVDAMKQGSW
jgi:site-specific recombinase XerD